MATAKQQKQRAEKLKKLLQELGNTPKRIAKSLKAKKITGHPTEPNSCPIANRVKKAFPKAIEVSVDDCETEIQFLGDPVRLTRRHSPALRQFVLNFDEGAYSELIAEDEE